MASPPNRRAARLARRRLLGAALAVAPATWLAGCREKHAPRPAAPRIRRICYLSLTPPLSLESPTEVAFQESLRANGWRDGDNLTIDRRFAEGDPERLRAFAAELAASSPDLIVTVSGAAAVAAKEATSTVPIVFSPVADPVGLGLVPSLARPGGNVTGVAFFTPEFTGKMLELLQELLPGLRRVGILWYTANAGATNSVRHAERIAPGLGLETPVLPLRDLADLEGAFPAARREGAQALLDIGPPLTLTNRARAATLAAEAAIPALWSAREFVQVGGLISYSPNAVDAWRRTGDYVARVLAGARPADLPVEQPAVFDLAVNRRTAATLGLSIPAAVLAQATEVIG